MLNRAELNDAAKFIQYHRQQDNNFEYGVMFFSDQFAADFLHQIEKSKWLPHQHYEALRVSCRRDACAEMLELRNPTDAEIEAKGAEIADGAKLYREFLKGKKLDNDIIAYSEQKKEIDPEFKAQFTGGAEAAEEQVKNYMRSLQYKSIQTMDHTIYQAGSAQMINRSSGQGL